MIDEPTRSLKLVEYNTIASSFCPLSNQVNKMHKYVMEKYGARVPFNYGGLNECGRNFSHRMLVEDGRLS